MTPRSHAIVLGGHQRVPCSTLVISPGRSGSTKESSVTCGPGLVQKCGSGVDARQSRRLLYIGHNRKGFGVFFSHSHAFAACKNLCTE